MTHVLVSSCINALWPVVISLVGTFRKKKVGGDFLSVCSLSSKEFVLNLEEPKNSVLNKVHKLVA